MGFLSFLLFWISGVLHHRPGAACAAKKMIPRATAGAAEAAADRRDRRRYRQSRRTVRAALPQGTRTRIRAGRYRRFGGVRRL